MPNPPQDLPSVIITTDGAARGNPGPGGWAALLQSGQRERLLAGGGPGHTTKQPTEPPAAYHQQRYGAARGHRRAGDAQASLPGDSARRLALPDRGPPAPAGGRRLTREKSRPLGAAAVRRPPTYHFFCAGAG